MRSVRVIVTCEHGGNRVPKEIAHLFAGRDTLLASHRGYDRGALDLAQRFAQTFSAPLIAATTTRLVIDMNRSRARRSLFSEITRPLPPETREALIARFLAAHRERVRAAVAEAVADGYVAVQLAAHTFAPVVRGRRRRADAALLYDPARATERAFCATVKACLKQTAPRLRVMRNNPFLGKNEGLNAWLRRRFTERDYLGIEVELNQRFLRRGPEDWRRARDDLIRGLVMAIGEHRF